jgi:hypothetical protein
MCFVNLPSRWRTTGRALGGMGDGVNALRMVVILGVGEVVEVRC